MTTNVNIYFDNILAKTRRKKGHKKLLRLRERLLISEKNIIETVVFVLGKAVRLLFKAVF